MARLNMVDNNRFVQFVSSIPNITPKQMFNELTKRGYHGQENARRAMCLMAYRHIRRIKRIYCNNVDQHDLPPKSNSLIMGPTGCGKTFLVETLFKDILKIPAVVVDITGFSETGYVGRDVVTIITSLIKAADDDPAKAQAGIICIDEFDKLAATNNTSRFEGQGSTKDVSGQGVQKELLKLLTAGEIDVPLEYNNTYYSSHIKMSVANIPLVACGAFSGFKQISMVEKDSTVGFHMPEEMEEYDDVAYDLNATEMNQIDNFCAYGFMPELIGRFSQIISIKPLDFITLKSILVDNIIPTFKREFSYEGITLNIKDSVISYLAKRAFNRRTGARGLQSELTGLIEDLAYDSFGGECQKATIDIKNGKPVIKLDREEVIKKESV